MVRHARDRFLLPLGTEVSGWCRHGGGEKQKGRWKPPPRGVCSSLCLLPSRQPDTAHTRCLQRLDVLSLRALRAFTNLELDLLILLESAEAAALNLGVVDEKVRGAIFWGNEAIALLRVKPLHSSLRHFQTTYLSWRTSPANFRRSRAFTAISTVDTAHGIGTTHQCAMFLSPPIGVHEEQSVERLMQRSSRLRVWRSG